MSKYIDQLTEDDIQNIYHLLFNSSAEIDTIHTGFENKIIVDLSNLKSFVLHDFDIYQNSTPMKKFANGLKIYDVYILYMAERFGDKYLLDLAIDGASVNEYQKQYEKAAKDLEAAKKIAGEIYDNIKAQQELDILSEVRQNPQITR